MVSRKNAILLVAVVLGSNFAYIVHTLLVVTGRLPSQILNVPLGGAWNGATPLLNDGGGRTVKEKCAPKKGVVVSALLGLTGNNLFEVAFANRMATQLCWDVVYRNAWRARPFLEEGSRCFPNAFLPSPNLTSGEKAELGIDSSLWKAQEDDIDPWIKSLEQNGRLLPCRHQECDFTQNGTEMLLERLGEESSGYRIFYAKAFFIHHGWMRGWEEEIHGWLRISSLCCKHIPPEDAVVIHLRDFGVDPDRVEPDVALPSGFYEHLLRHYDLMQRPVWIVCQPASVNSQLVQELVNRLPHALVQPGDDQYDAFCILQRAKTLVLSHKSTFSQAAALSASAGAIVHYPILNLRPFLTIGMPHWKYHVVGKNRSEIVMFDVPANSLRYRMDSETPEPVQMREVGISPVEATEGYTSGRFCITWDRNVDSWWAENPEWGVESASYEYQCFKRYPDERARFLRDVHDLQWSGNCTTVHTRHMWSSGWGADFSNVVDGLILGFEEGRPFQITFVEDDKWWHYSAVKRDGANPTCASKDMFCYFLPLSKCKPGQIEFDFGYVENNEKNALRRKWLMEYATRQQQWLRRSVFEYMKEKAPKMPTTCTAMHVRRSDVVLHDESSRKYFPISSYLEKAGLTPKENVLLLTDDANAIQEAHEFHPEYNWIYLKRKRHRGSEGGWENQTPSKNPKEEVIILLTILELAKQCNAFVHTDSNLANVIYDSMTSTGRPVERFRADEDLEEKYHSNNTASEAALKEKLESDRIAMGDRGTKKQSGRRIEKRRDEGMKRRRGRGMKKGGDNGMVPMKKRRDIGREQREAW